MERRGRGRVSEGGREGGRERERENQNYCFTDSSEQGSSMDYTVGTSRVRILAGSTTPDSAIVTFRVDAIAQEPDETLSLQLLPLISGPTSDEIFFRDSITLTIVDSDSE